MYDQLAGHEVGAFTGAQRSVRGAFERAHNGTLFLDELPLWSIPAQSALLRVVDEGVITRLGAERHLRTRQPPRPIEREFQESRRRMRHRADLDQLPKGRQHGRIRVVIADDHRLFLEAAQRLLERQGFAVVGVATDGEEVVRVSRAKRPHVAVLDVVMPKLNGLDAARALHSAAPDTAVVLLTGSTDLGFVMQGMALGVRAFCVKTAAAVELFDAVKAAAQRATYVSPAYDPLVRSALPVPSASAGRLTARERQVLRLIADGKTTKEIARTLDIAVKTAETHRTRIMKKLDVHDIAGLVRYAIREHIASA